MEKGSGWTLLAIGAAAAAAVLVPLLTLPRGPEPASTGAWPGQAEARGVAEDRARRGVPLATPEHGQSGARAAVQAGAPTPAVAVPAALAVRVVGPGGEPLGGARVRLWSAEREVHGTTGEAGRVELPLPEHRPLFVGAEKPGYFHLVRSVDPGFGGTLVLHRAIPLAGQVRETGSGTPIPGAELAFAHGDCSGCPPERALSDGNGVYRFAAIPAGRKLELEVQAQGYLGARPALRAAPDARAAELDVLLGPGLAVAVAVVDAQTRLPIGGAEVGGLGGPFATDDAGRVESDQLVSPANLRDDLRTRLEVAAPGYCRLTLHPRIAELVARPELVVPLVRAVTVAGSVRGARGEVAGPAELSWSAARWRSHDSPAPGGAAEHARSELTRWLAGLPPWSLAPERGASLSPLTTEADGSFTLRGMVPWSELHLAAEAPDGSRGDDRITLPGPGTTATARIELDPVAASSVARIRGRLLLNGAPEDGRVHWSGTTRSGSARTGTGGRFELADVEPGPIELRAESDRLPLRSACPLAELAPIQVFAQAGEELAQDLAIELPLAPIAGRVLDSDGEPVRITVEARDARGCWQARAPTDERGRYALDVPAALPAYLVSVERAPEHLIRRPVAPGAEGVDFVLATLGRLRFRAVDESDGSVLRRGVVHWRRPGTPFRMLADMARLVAEPGGWYEVDCVSGALELAVWSTDEQAPAPTPAVVHPGATTTIQFLLRPSLNLRVLFEQGSIRPPAGLAGVVVLEGLFEQVRFAPGAMPQWHGPGHGSASGAAYDELRFKPNGTAVARGLRPGSYRIKLWPESVRIEPDRLRVSAGESDVTVLARLAWR
jgi:hypothetical protein